jgi:hypothetical protein
MLGKQITVGQLIESLPNNKGRKVSVVGSSVGSSNIFVEPINPSTKLHITLNATGK